MVDRIKQFQEQHAGDKIEYGGWVEGGKVKDGVVVDNPMPSAHH